MSFSKVAEQPPARDSALGFNDAGPGLYPGEVLVDLGGELVAVSVASTWLETGEGVAFRAWARWTEEGGATRTKPRAPWEDPGQPAQHIETEYAFTATLAFLDHHGGPLEGVAAISRELMLLVMGEPFTPISIPVDEGEEPLFGTLLSVSDENCRKASIRRAIELANSTSPDPDAAELLGLTP